MFSDPDFKVKNHQGKQHFLLCHHVARIQALFMVAYSIAWRGMTPIWKHGSGYSPASYVARIKKERVHVVVWIRQIRTECVVLWNSSTVGQQLEGVGCCTSIHCPVLFCHF